MLKSLFFFVISVTFVAQLSAQVTFDLQLLPDNKTYVVSAKSSQTWNERMSQVGSVQVVLRVDADKAFEPNITSLVPGVTWTDNAYVHHPASPNKQYVCIALVERGNSNFTFIAGKSQALFTFENVANTCAGTVELVSNTDEDVQAIRAGGFNVTQNMSVLGAQGNAITGLSNASVTCQVEPGQDPAETLKDLTIYPNPSTDRVYIKWLLNEPVADDSKATIIVYNVLGLEITRVSTSAKPTGMGYELMVDNWAPDAYFLQLLIDNKVHSSTKSFIVVR